MLNSIGLETTTTPVLFSQDQWILFFLGQGRTFSVAFYDAQVAFKEERIPTLNEIREMLNTTYSPVSIIWDYPRYLKAVVF